MVYKHDFDGGQIRLILTSERGLIEPIVLANKELLFEDGQDSSSYTPNTRDIWLLGYNQDNQIVGFIRFEHRSSVCVEIHGATYKKHRVKYARELVLAAMEWLYEVSDYRKVISCTPMCYKPTINFMNKLGFVLEGVNGAAWRKNDKLHDVVNLGFLMGEL
jgi:RimJ/RimL family protein N-acetyltransferase